GGGSGAAANAIIIGGVGSAPVAISGTMMTAPIRTVCTIIDTGTVYHFWLPTLMDGSTISPNISRATACLPYGLCLAAGSAAVGSPAKGGDYSQLKNGESTNWHTLPRFFFRHRLS